MLETLFDTMHVWEMSVLQQLQLIRNPICDYFFTLLNFFDTDYFYFLVLPTIWGVYGRKWGVRLIYLLLFCAIVNNYAKDLFMQPRPSQLDPSLGLITLHSFGFPSGAAQTHLLLAGLVIISTLKFWPVLGCIIYVLLISFSRVYLGVHFITDILGGWAIGLLLLAIYTAYHTRIEVWVKSLSRYKALAVAFLVPAIFLIIHPSLKILIFSSLILGVNLGLWLNVFISEVSELHSWKMKALYLILSLIGLFLLATNTVSFKQNPNASSMAIAHFALTYTAIGIWLSWGVERLL
ncbi:MAG: phosphatase PAP2 family protein, partial [Verrucomicrobia bacterium]|nr:phosphatase PAP2 family protein [Verrucomicrobiota bacterium]